MQDSVIKAELAGLKERIKLKGAKYEVQIRALEAAMQAQLLAMRENTALAFSASEKAIAKAETANEKRFESVNEFRQTLTDQTASFMPRAQIDALLANLNEKISGLVGRIERNEGRDAGKDRTVDVSKVNWHLMIATIAAVVAIGSLLVTLFMARAHVP